MAAAISKSKLRPAKYSKISNGADSHDHSSPQSNGANVADSGSESDVVDTFPLSLDSSASYNATHLARGLVRDLVERLKIGITFLLDDRSPLWSEERGDEKQSVSVKQVYDRNLESRRPNSMWTST